MPYAPGIQDMRGQLLGQGIQQAGDAMANGFQEYRVNQQKDQAARGIVTGIISQVPDLIKSADPETLKLLDKFKQGQTKKDDNVYLAGLLATASKQKGEVDQQKAQAVQTQALQQQMADRAKQAQQLQLLQQYAGGQGRGVLSPQIQNNPYFAQAAQVAQATGQAPSPESMLSLAGKLGAVKPDKTEPEVHIDPVTGARAWFSPGTGGISPIPQTAEQLGAIEESKNDAKLASDYVATVPVAAEAARSSLPQLQKIKALYAQSTETGGGQAFMNNAGSYLSRLGLIDPSKQANREELQGLLAQNALQNARIMLSGQGPVSEGERARVDQMSANVNKSEAANLRIINYAQALGQRQLELEARRQELVDQNLSTKQVAEKLRRWQAANPVQGFVDKIEDADDHKKKVKAALPTGWKVN